MALPIPALRLHRRRVQLRDATLDGASLFPFFDDQGATVGVMLVWPGSSQIYWLAWRPGLARAHWWRAIEVDVAYAELRDLTAERAAGIASARHYDPWWVLREPRYAGHRAVPALKATNCAHQVLGDEGLVPFTADLSRLLVQPGRIFQPRRISPAPAVERRGAVRWELRRRGFAIR